MAWIETHQSLRLHTKTLNASTALRCDRHKFIGHLMSLWWWGLDVADMDGNLPAGTTSGVIAAGAEWPVNKSREFVEALKTAGFLDENDGRFMLHDWWDYAGKYNSKRAANKSRMRDARALHVQRTDGTRAAHVQGLPVQPVPTNQPTNQHQPAPTSTPPAVPLPSPGVARQVERCFGRLLSPMELERIKALEDEHPVERIEYALREAAEHNARNLSYVKSVCERRETDGDTDHRRVQAAVGADDPDARYNFGTRLNP